MTMYSSGYLTKSATQRVISAGSPGSPYVPGYWVVPETVSVKIYDPASGMMRMVSLQDHLNSLGDSGQGGAASSVASSVASSGGGISAVNAAVNSVSKNIRRIGSETVDSIVFGQSRD